MRGLNGRAAAARAAERRCDVMRRAGFTLVELLLGATITLVLTAGLFAVAAPSQRACRRQPAMFDMQQRLRAATEVITADLLAAGGGPVGGILGAPLGAITPAVLPCWRASRGDAPGTARSDAITLLSASSAWSAVRTADAWSASGGWVRLGPDQPCPAEDPACGLAEGAAVLVLDGRGAFDLLTVAAVSGGAIRLLGRGPTSGWSFAAGSLLVPVAVDTYRLREATDGSGAQLMHGDGHRSEMPLIDHVTALRFEYFGEPRPPMLRPAAGAREPPTSYGPAPPLTSAEAGRSDWPPGENCVFLAAAEGFRTRLTTLADDSPGLVQLDPATFGDGPWCPGPLAANRVDADALRIRKVRVTLRVEAASPALRGAEPRLFTRPGESRDGRTWVPDQEVVFDVVPRNLALGR